MVMHRVASVSCQQAHLLLQAWPCHLHSSSLGPTLLLWRLFLGN